MEVKIPLCGQGKKREIIIVGSFCRTRGRRMGKCEKGGLLRGGRAWGCEGLRGRNKGKRQNETVQRYSPCRRLPVGFAEVKSSDFHRRERLRPRWEGLRGAIRFDSLSRQRQRVFPTADLFIGTALPSQSRDTASVLPYGNLPSPPKGRFGRSAAPHHSFARAPLR